MKFKRTAALILAVAAALSLTACGNKAGDEAKKKASNEEVVFTVGNQEITVPEMETYISLYTSNNYTFDDAKEYATEDAKNNASMSALVDAMGLKYTDEENKARKEQKDAIIENQGGKDEYEKYLEKLGVNDAFIDKMLDAQFAQQKLFSDDISDEAAKNYFNERYVRAKHILVSTMDTSTQTKYDDAKKAEQKTLADSLLKRAQSGEDFDALMKEYSEDPGSERNPDGYYFTDGEMVEPFENKTKELGENEIGICESDYGYHIIKRLPLDEGSDAYNTAFEGVKQSVMNKLIQSAVQNKLPLLLKEYKLEVKMNEKVYNSITEKSMK